MPLIYLETLVKAPAERIFDLSLDVDAHVASASGTEERVVAGVMSGRMRLGDTVTWEARHFGVRLRLTTAITAYDRPAAFTDAIVSGPFARMVHVHRFVPAPGGTLMIDEFDYASPLGPLGWIADALFVRRHLEGFLRERNAKLKAMAERPFDSGAAARPLRSG